MAETEKTLSDASTLSARMRKVIYTDRAGYKRAAMIRDDDPDEMASKGIPVDPPDLEHLDWEGIKRDIHNNLVSAGITTWADIVRGQNTVTGVVTRVLKKHIVRLYRFEEKERLEEMSNQEVTNG